MIDKRPRKPLEKADAEILLKGARHRVADLEKQLSEAIEIIKIYSRPDQVGGLAAHAQEYLSKWGVIGSEPK